MIKLDTHYIKMKNKIKQNNMDTGLLDFLKEYIDMMIDGKDTNKDTDPLEYENRNTVSFYLGVRRHQSGFGINFYGHTIKRMFKLDDEDLKYLYDKYSARLEEEMENNLKEIKGMYAELLNKHK